MLNGNVTFIFGKQSYCYKVKNYVCSILILLDFLKSSALPIFTQNPEYEANELRSSLKNCRFAVTQPTYSIPPPPKKISDFDIFFRS